MNRRILILGVLALSCGGSDFTSTTPNVICSPGETTSCPCSGSGLIGAQDCNDVGTAYTACRCPDDQGGGGSTSTTSSSLGGGGDVGQGGMGGIGGTGGTSVGGSGGSGGVCVPNFNVCNENPKYCGAHSDGCDGFQNCGNCDSFVNNTCGGFIPDEYGDPQPGGIPGVCGNVCAETPTSSEVFGCGNGNTKHWTCLMSFSQAPYQGCILSFASPPSNSINWWCCP